MKLFPLMFLLFLASCGSAPVLDRALGDPYLPNHAANSPAGDTTDPLRIVILDVGQGDATLLITPDGESMLIDAGPKGAGRERILPFLKAQGIEILSLVLFTHHHRDHTGGFGEILRGPDGVARTEDDILLKGAIYEREASSEATEDEFDLLPEDADLHTWKTALAGDQIQLGDLSVEVMAANGVLSDGSSIDLAGEFDENAMSMVLCLEYGSFRMLLPGDITGGGGDPPYETPDVESALAPLIGDLDVLHTAHHGSKTSTNQTLLDLTTPEIAIISVGDGNDFFHPHASVIDRLLEAHIEIFQTESGWPSREGPEVVNGHIIIEVEDDGSYQMSRDEL